MTGDGWLLVSGVCGTIIMAGCMPNSVRSAAPVPIEQSSPQDVVETFCAAVLNADYAVMLQCMEPSAQDEYDEILVFSKQLTDALASALSEVERRIGRTEAEELRQKVWPGFLLSPLRDVEQNGALAWDRIELKASGEQAQVFVQGERTPRLTLKHRGGLWYIGRDFEGGPPSKEDMGWWKRILAAGRRSLDEIRQRVVDGRINRDNFVTQFWHEDEVPYGPPLDGVALKILPADGPVYGKGEPLAFRLRASINYEWGARPRRLCWQMPPDGWGDNVLVELDGKPFRRPSGLGKVIWGWAEHPFPHTEQWTIALPEGLDLKPGWHTVRYILLSEGGAYVDDIGNAAPILKGKLISNLLRFAVR